MTDTDVLGLDTALRELREGLRLMELRLDQRDAATQSTIQTLTRQMVQMEVTIDARFDRLETMLADIARKLT
jgi:hypothetical protein